MSTSTTNLTLRRRTATLAAMALTAALALTGLTSTPVAAAVGNVTGANPPAISNSTPGTGDPCDSGKTLIAFRTSTPFAQGGEPPTLDEPGRGTQVDLVRTETDTTLDEVDEDEDVIRGDVVELSDQDGTEDPFVTPACFRFGPGVDGTDPPANPDDYNVYVHVGERAAGDRCVSCFDVFSAAPVITTVHPPQVPLGPIPDGQIYAVYGNNYAKDTIVEALFPGTSLVDRKVTFTEAYKEPLVAGQLRFEIDNTRTKLSRTVGVDPSATPGFRDLRVVNTDGRFVIRPNGLRITSIYIDRIEPSASDNTSVVRATLHGRGFPAGSAPSLVDEASGTVIRATNVVSDTSTATIGDFDLRGARPGTYRAHLVAPDGSSSVPECSPTFTVVDTAGVSGRADTVRTEFGCRSTGAPPGSSPGPGASPSASPSPSPSPSVSVTPSPSTAATTSPSPSASASVSASPSPTASASPTATSAPPPPPSGSRYAGLSSPVRVLDTRLDGDRQRRTGEIVLDLGSRISDVNATAAVLNVTVTNASARGFVVAYPHGTPKPGTSNVNVNPGQTQANEVVVGLSSADRVALFVDSMSAHVVVDLVGVLTTRGGNGPGRVTTSAPVRAFDSRTTGVPRRSGEVVLDLFERLPAGATDAILNVTVTQGSARGFVTVFPTGTSRPGTSNVNFERGQTQANEVVTRVGTGSNAGRVSFFIDSAEAALIVDVVGAVTSSSASGVQYATALARPTRALDTRADGPRRTGEVEVPMPSSVPANATGVVLNVTATNGTRPGFVTVFPSGSQNPGTSNVNFPGERRATATTPASAGTQANEVVSALGSNRRVTLFVGGAGTPTAHLIVDVVGYLTP